MTSPPPRLPAAVAALTGLLAVAAALGAGHLVAGLVTPTASPFLAVGNGAIDLTPPALKDFAVRTFGARDKLVLLLGMAVVIAGVGAAAGLLSRRSPRPGLVVVAVLGAVGAVAVLTRPTAGALDAAAPLAALAAGVAAFALLHRAARRAPRGTAAGRRGLLTAAAATAAGAGVAGLGGQLLTARGSVESSRRALGAITADDAAPPVPAGADFAAEGTPTFLTPNAEFYRVDVNLTVPQLKAEDWRLRVHGRVDRGLVIDFDDLLRRPSVERVVTMTCVSNEVGGPYVSTARFTGVLLADLLAEAGVQEGADQVFTTSVDGWTCGTPTEAALDPARGAMLVYGMNGEPLPAEHGFPVRMLVPGLYGFVSGTKWIVDLELTTFAERRAYWRERDWAERAPIKTQSRIDSPGSFETVAAGTPITGVAWAQTRGVTRVEVRVDGGQWQEAELAAEVNRDTWRMWRLAGRLAPGPHSAEVRATDGDGATQTPDRVAPIPDGASGWHSVRFTVA